MKPIISAVISIALLIGAPSMQKVLANQAYTEQEAGVASDKMGRVCNYGPSHDECRDPFLERTENLPVLPANQHYGECEQDSKGLACDILNDGGSPNPGVSSP
ncbi:MAG TPA: hypothetical protein VH796_13325 [Nitrososphaeraceae archaeon]|jgi:hypothetical protein